MNRWKQLPLALVYALPFLMMVAPGAAKDMGSHVSAAAIEKVRVVPNGDKLKIVVQLSGSVSPRVLIANNPDRLVLELPNTNAKARQQHIEVNQQGVKDLRIGLTSSSPMITRLVVDLDCAHPYGLSTDGNTIALTVLPPVPGEDPATIPGMIGTALAGSVTSAPAVTRTAVKHVQMGFKVKYVAEGVAYLTGGRAAGLEEGMILIVPESKKGGRVIMAGDATGEVAELQVLSVAETSAVTEVHDAKRVLKPGDWAYLSVSETVAVMEHRSAGRKGPVSGDWISVEQGEGLIARAPRVEPRPEQRVRGRIGLDYSGISGSVGNSSAVGLVARSDITNIGGTHWNLQGYWRGRLTKQSRTDEPTLQTALNKTYTMQLFYDNPESKWVAGFGRLWLPWANSLDVLDGGYIGRKVHPGIIVGAFAGSNPDLASFRYTPNQRTAGSFVNFEGDAFGSIHYTSTAGIALTSIKWRLDRPFIFFENGMYYKNTFSVYHDLIADSPQGLTTNGITPGAGISRSYLTVHYQPVKRVGLDFYHNYFRDVPTASTALIGTGLVDKLLYQGVSFGVRVQPVKHVWLYTTLGRSDRTGDERQTLNQMYGLTIDEIGHTGLRADMRYSKFNSSFGSGDYKLLTLSRHLGDRMMWDMQFGNQMLVSPYSKNQMSNFIDSSFDVNLWGKSFLQSGYTYVHGDQLSYKQWYMSLGWRFDAQPQVNREKP